MMATAKLTLSLKRRLSNGDEVFIAPGIEMHCGVDELDAKQAEVQERVTGWLTELTEAFPDAELEDEDDEDEDEEDEDDEDEDEDDEDDGDDEDDEDDEDELTEEEIEGMALKDLKAVVKEYELDIKVTGMKKADLAEAIIEALFADEDEEDEDDDEDGDDEDDEDAYTEDELEEMKLADLQEIADEWEMEHPKLKKGTPVAKKKAAYIKAILEEQEG